MACREVRGVDLLHLRPPGGAKSDSPPGLHARLREAMSPLPSNFFTVTPLSPRTPLSHLSLFTSYSRLFRNFRSYDFLEPLSTKVGPTSTADQAGSDVPYTVCRLWELETGVTPLAEHDESHNALLPSILSR